MRNIRLRFFSRIRGPRTIIVSAFVGNKKKHSLRKLVLDLSKRVVFYWYLFKSISDRIFFTQSNAISMRRSMAGIVT